ncbi:hypothetical protein AQJ30_15770 [Streptomyces longwoodensis]|uniref:Transposase n=1 Tax=Streptomyces longwoodensis TaxID=68231 RepID=A0A101QX46_9ACTN|nr:hypothetical protein [Streptomyces longwoodensis]KUN37740.1 hypothetical protein AQJ30_15770 [Streptomyces longwoodensis]
MRLIPPCVRRRLKRRRHARTWRAMEVFTFNHAPAPTWNRIRTWNDAARIWKRRPEHPHKDSR